MIGRPSDDWQRFHAASVLHAGMNDQATDELSGAVLSHGLTAYKLIFKRPVAQRLEPSAHNRLVASSNLAGPTILSIADESGCSPQRGEINVSIAGVVRCDEIGLMARTVVVFMNDANQRRKLESRAAEVATLSDAERRAREQTKFSVTGDRISGIAAWSALAKRGRPDTPLVPLQVFNLPLDATQRLPINTVIAARLDPLTRDL